MKIIFSALCLIAASATFAQTGKVGVNTTTPQAKLDVVGDTLGLRNSASWDNLWFTVDGASANMHASGAENGLSFKVGSNSTGTYGNGQGLKTVMTMLPSGGVGVGTASPDTSAALEVRSTNKGMLVPRVSTTQLLNIGNPAKGLLVYDSTVGAFYFYSGTAWSRVGADNLGNHTATQMLNLAGNAISNDGSTAALTVDNSGNATVAGMVTASTARISNTGGNAYDFLTKSNASGDVGTRKAHGALAMRYIICTNGAFPSTSGGTNYQDAFLGEVKLVAFNFGGSFQPGGWAECNGQLLPINGNQALFAILGTTYGGNGSSTFALPDLRGAVPVGTGTTPAPAGYTWSMAEKVQ